MQKQRKDKTKNEIVFRVGEKVFLEKDSELVKKNLSRKIDNRAFVPCQIYKVMTDKGNVEIQIAPESTLIVKQSNLRLTQNQKVDLTHLYKSDLTKPIT